MTKEELKLNLLKKKKISLSRTIEKVQKQLDELSEMVKEDEGYKDLIKNKYCIVCSYREKKNDFFIPEGIVCTHPSNQNGKDRFKYHQHTCEHWVNENEIKDGTLVRYKEYPDRLFVVVGTQQFCGQTRYKIETIDKKLSALVDRNNIEIEE